MPAEEHKTVHTLSERLQEAAGVGVARTQNVRVSYKGNGVDAARSAAAETVGHTAVSEGVRGSMRMPHEQADRFHPRRGHDGVDSA